MFFTCFFSSTLLASSVPSMFYVCWFIFLPWTMILVFYKFHSMPNGDAISQRLCCWLQLLVPSFTEFVGRPFGDWNHFFFECATRWRCSANETARKKKTKPLDWKRKTFPAPSLFAAQPIPFDVGATRQHGNSSANLIFNRMKPEWQRFYFVLAHWIMDSLIMDQ